MPGSGCMLAITLLLNWQNTPAEHNSAAWTDPLQSSSASAQLPAFLPTTLRYFFYKHGRNVCFGDTFYLGYLNEAL